MALKCPEGYGLKEATSDLFRMQRLSKSQAKTEEKDAEKVHLLARLWAYNRSPEAKGRARLAELQQRGSSCSAEEQSELNRLTELFPQPPLDPGHPRYRQLERERVKKQKEQERDRMIFERHTAWCLAALERADANERKRQLENELFSRRRNKPRDDTAEQIDPDELR